MIYFTTPPDPCILNQYLWCNKYVGINKKNCIFWKKKTIFERFSEHNMNFVMDLSEKSGKLKSWYVFKTENNLNHTSYFRWLQLTDTISKTWKDIVQNNINNNGSLTFKDHHILQSTRILSINKLTARELYSILMSNIENKPTSRIYMEKK